MKSLKHAELAVIHIAKKDLGWDDDLYRYIMEQETGKTSAAKLTAKERAKFLDYMGSKGFVRKTKKKLPFQKSTNPQVRMMYGIWADLKKIGALNNPEASLLAFLKSNHVTNVDDIKWLQPEEIGKAVEMLKKFKTRFERENDVKSS